MCVSNSASYYLFHTSKSIWVGTKIIVEEDHQWAHRACPSKMCPLRKLLLQWKYIRNINVISRNSLSTIHLTSISWNNSKLFRIKSVIHIFCTETKHLLKMSSPEISWAISLWAKLTSYTFFLHNSFCIP